MELTYLHTFREVAYHKSFTKAAAKLGYAQSSVTMQMQKLEQAYDVKLFERFGKGLRLTSAGEALLKIAVQMLELYHQSKELLALQGGGTLTIGSIDSVAAYVLPPRIQHIRQQYPDLTVKLQTDSEASILEKVKEGEYDIGLLLEGQPSDPLLSWTRVREEPLVLIASPNHPLSEQTAVTLSDLRDSEWMMTEASCNYRLMLEKVLQSHRIPYRIGLELGNPEAIKRCVMTGSGIAFMPRMTVQEEIRRGELLELPFSHPELRLDLQMVLHPKKWISQALQGFMDILHGSS